MTIEYKDLLTPNFFLQYWLFNYNDLSKYDIPYYLDFITHPKRNSLGFSDYPEPSEDDRIINKLLNAINGKEDIDEDDEKEDKDFY